ncbi:MAG: zinc carboxypeptidase [Treponema sp.]|nr:zinc carboxypeptidase [Treponema sp.]
MRAIIDRIINGIPDYKAFLTVDEMDESSKKLSEKYPDLVKISVIGKTRADHPLYCLKIGTGSKNALMFGCPHPNEPIGAMMLEYFTEQLATDKEFRDSLDYTWYIVKAWDADGTKLNEKWFKGPFTIYNYTRNFFRPAGNKQVEWTFPIKYKDYVFDQPIPETQAMMKLIDEIKPVFIYSLHNAGFGGVYWYTSKDTPEIYNDLRNAALKQKIPLALGEPEVPYGITYSPAVYKMINTKDSYDYLEKHGIRNLQEVLQTGTCSADYANDVCNALTFLTELPYFYDPRIDDTSDSDVIRKDAVLDKLQFVDECHAIIKEIKEISNDYLDKENPFKLAIESFTRSEGNEATRKMVNENPDFLKKATVAELFDNALIIKFYLNLSYGLLVRANESELFLMKERNENNPAKKEALEKAKARAEEKLNELSAFLEENLNYSVVPIKKLVAIQLECGLLMADHLQKQ